MKETIRAFIAFELPESIVRLAADLQDQLQSHGMKLRWVRPRNIHLTVKFLGDIHEGRSADVIGAMQAAAGRTAPMTVTAQGLGVFPGIRKPRVLWFGLGGQTDRLAEAHQQLDNELAATGFARERRPFRPHLTLARFKQAVNTRRLHESIQDVGGYPPVEFQLEEWVLLKSDLRPQGAIYTPLQRVPLCGA